MHTSNVHTSTDTTILDFIRYFLKTTLQEIMSIVNAECGSCFIFDRATKELVLDSYLNSREVSIKDIKRRIGEGISGKVVEINSPVLVRDIDNDPRFNRNGFNHYTTKSFISIPLIGSDGLIGVINIADKSTGEPFSEKDLQFAVTLCKYACVIVENLFSSSRVNEEKQKLEAQKKLLEKYATVGKLAASVVHQINNPLDGILRYTNMIINQMEQHSVVREYLLEIKHGLNRIGNITKSLLEFSHLVNSDSVKFKRYVNIYELLEDSLAIFKVKISGNIQIIKNYGLKLPRVLDMGISHVLINIIKNAIDAMPEGGTLDISTEIKNSVVYICFKDTGFGIPADIKDRIFEPFFTTKSMDKGTGLGLAISKEIVNKYDGKIEVQSVQGNGSTFTVLIPEKYLENANQQPQP